MSEKEFHWFCRFLNWSTNVSLVLMLVVLTLMPFAFFMSDDKPWVGLIAFFGFILIFYNNKQDKVKFIAREEVSKGYHGTTGVMFSLWENAFAWFFYTLIEVAAVILSINIFAKTIWPN